MELTEKFPTMTVKALIRLQESGRSINDLAREIGVPSRWLHMVKSSSMGQQTVERYIQVYLFLAESGELLDSAPDTQADSSATLTSGSNNQDKTVAICDRHGVSVALSGAGAESSAGAFNTVGQATRFSQ